MSSASLDVAAAVLVGELELVDDDVRSAFVGQLDSGGTPVCGSSTCCSTPSSSRPRRSTAAIGRDSGDRQMDALRSLSLLRVDLRPEADGAGEPFAEFEYALAPDDTDERLIAAIDIGREVVDVRFEG